MEGKEGNVYGVYIIRTSLRNVETSKGFDRLWPTKMNKTYNTLLTQHKNKNTNIILVYSVTGIDTYCTSVYILQIEIESVVSTQKEGNMSTNLQIIKFLLDEETNQLQER